MSVWSLPVDVSLEAAAPAASPCFVFAQEELVRLLGRVGTRVRAGASGSGDAYVLRLGEAPAAGAVAGLAHDGYEVAAGPRGAVIAAPTAKGALNGVYELAEQLGFRFLMPGEAGEWPPATTPATLPERRWRREPRFAHRGVFGGLNVPPFSTEDWLRFFAKLRFNAQSHRGDETVLCARLGIRLEAGGHGMSDLLPRELFAEHPEYFRMFQPEDFAGKRQPDANFCVTHPASIGIVKDNFRRRLDALPGVYAVHAWADDLPGGGWCMCPRCRAFSASDQSVLAMRMQAAVVAEAHPEMRVPVIAYHDTLFPGKQVPPAPECFLLYAPRERCYAHALDDPACAKNRWHLEALHAWMAAFAGIDDAHTFEYYFDQILYRGLYPFIPEVILRDMAVYERAGIESHMSLQVGGGLLAPDANLLTFARAHWDATLTAERVITELAAAFDPANPAPWRQHLDARQRAYTRALAVCDVPNDIYFDYRFMPELTLPSGAAMVRDQAAAAAELREAADAFAAAIPAMPPRTAELARREVDRSRFEAADIEAMSLHQAGLNELAHWQLTPTPDRLRQALDKLEAADAQLARTAELAREIGMPTGAYYHNFNEKWTRPEIRAKITTYRATLA